MTPFADPAPALFGAAKAAGEDPTPGERGPRAALVAAARSLAERGVGHICEGPFRRVRDETPNPISCSGLIAWCARRVFDATESQLQQVGLGGAEQMWSTAELRCVPLRASKAGDLLFYTRETNEGKEWHVMMLANHWRVVGSCPMLRRDQTGYGLVVEHGLLAYERETPWQRIGAKAFPVLELQRVVAEPTSFAFAFDPDDLGETQ